MRRQTPPSSDLYQEARRPVAGPTPWEAKRPRDQRYGETNIRPNTSLNGGSPLAGHRRFDLRWNSKAASSHRNKFDASRQGDGGQPNNPAVTEGVIDRGRVVSAMAASARLFPPC